MKVVFSEFFYPCYVDDAAAAEGRMESIVGVIHENVMFFEAEPASEEDILAVHDREQLERVRRKGLYEIASLAAGGAIQTAMIGLKEPAFGLIRPPGHHASSFMSWGYCYFNNMAVAVARLKNDGLIRSCLILDIDLHYGDGTVNILGDEDWVSIHNPVANTREKYIEDVRKALRGFDADILGISAGFDNHRRDWGGLLETQDYRTIGNMVRETCERSGAGYFALLEGGYRKKVLGYNVQALLDGMERRSPAEIETASDMGAVREIFQAYADALDFDLDFQNFKSELEDLPGRYAPPEGALLVARIDGQTVGCVGVRKWEEKICEMKRLFVVERFRGRAAGRKLAEAAVAAARKAGYEEMRLDTVSSMAEAVSIYEKLGFFEIPRYRVNPVENARFFALNL